MLLANRGRMCRWTSEPYRLAAVTDDRDPSVIIVESALDDVGQLNVLTTSVTDASRVGTPQASWEMKGMYLQS